MEASATDILLRPIKKISLSGGNVLRAIKASDPGFAGFGEAYFSYIHHLAIKAWKLHTRYTVNFVIPLGKVEIMVYKDGAKGIPAEGYPKKIILSEEEEHYQCLTIPPGIWYGFKGLAKPTSLIFSLLNGEHTQEEQRDLSVEEFPYPCKIEHDESILKTQV